MNPSLALVVRVVDWLGPLADEFLFVGGAVVPFLVDGPSEQAQTRLTSDVDAVASVATWIGYVALGEKLRAAGFDQSAEDTVICRWRREGAVLDVMPLADTEIGTANRWYASAYDSAPIIDLPGGQRIRVLDAPHFIATKLEAFADRGRDDPMVSHDIEDIVTVVADRATIVEEIRAAPGPLRAFVAMQVASLQNHPDWDTAVEGHLANVEHSRLRAGTTLGRFLEISQLA